MMLSFKERHAVIGRLKLMQRPVRLVHFTQTLECPSCADAERLLTEVAQLSDMLTLEILNLHAARDRAAHYGIEHVPAIVVESTIDYGIRFYGLPAGYEFAVLLETILLVSNEHSGLDPQVSASLAPLAAPVHLQVFSTPTCPYCPGMALLAGQLAKESELIRADLFDATEFPAVVRAHNIGSVPKTIINGTLIIDGAVPARVLADAVLRATRPQGSSSPNHTLEDTK